MFNTLTERFVNIFSKLKGRGLLQEEDILNVLREIRIALLEADVALPTAKKFVEKVKEKSLGKRLIAGVSPEQMITKIVFDELVDLLGEKFEGFEFKESKKHLTLFVGLQGTGKTTTISKVAFMLQKKHSIKPLLVSLDIYRPAAQEQLEILGKNNNIDCLPIIKSEKPNEIINRALKHAKEHNYQHILLDSAGRLHIDDERMSELQDIQKKFIITQTFLVTDAMIGQDAVNIAQEFNNKIDLSGIILTRLDGDTRGGAALSIRDISGCPIILLGTGEKIDELEFFDPKSIANRILGRGDIVGLVEEAQANIDKSESDNLLKEISSKGVTLLTFQKQLKQLQKMGGIVKFLKFAPKQITQNKRFSSDAINDKVVKQQIAIIDSMTFKEKIYPNLLDASRKKRIAKGAGVEVSQINQLLKQYEGLKKVMKKFKKADSKNLKGNLDNLLRN